MSTLFITITTPMLRKSMVEVFIPGNETTMDVQCMESRDELRTRRETAFRRGF